MNHLYACRMAQAPEAGPFRVTTHHSPMSYEQAYAILNSQRGKNTKLLLAVMHPQTHEVTHESVYDMSSTWTEKHREQIAFWMRRVHRVRVLEEVEASHNASGAA